MPRTRLALTRLFITLAMAACPDGTGIYSRLLAINEVVKHYQRKPQ